MPCAPLPNLNMGLSVNCRHNHENIRSLSGVEQMVNLTILNVNTNSLSGGLSLAANTALTYLDVGNNSLTSIDVSQNTALTQLFANANSLTSIDVSANTALTHLNVINNDLRSLDVSQNTALDELQTGSMLWWRWKHFLNLYNGE